MAAEIKCPICGSETIVRTTKKGSKAGYRFHVCISYPECKGKVPASRLSIQQSKQVNALEWSEEKTRAYKAKGTTDPKILSRVAIIVMKHDDELKEFWHQTSPEKRDELVESFFNELKQEWPTEFSELQLEKVFHATAEWLLTVGIRAAYVAGYMAGKGWITLEELTEWNLLHGDYLATQVRSTIRRTKSRGQAFAAAFVIVCVQGTLVAQAALYNSMLIYEPSKHEIIEEILRSEGQRLLRINLRNPELLDPTRSVIIDTNPFVKTDSNYLTHVFLSLPMGGSFDRDRMDTIIKKLLKDDYQRTFNAAKQRIISRR